MRMNKPEERPDPEAFTNPSPHPDQDIHLAILGDLLRKLGVRRIIVPCEGSAALSGVAKIDFLPEGLHLPPGLKETLHEVAHCYRSAGCPSSAASAGTLTLYPVEGLARLERWERFEEREAIDFKPMNLASELRVRLSHAGISRVQARFRGAGGSGRMDEWTVRPASAQLDSELEEDLEYFLLDQLPWGWQDQEGSFGEFTVDVGAGQVEMEAYRRLTKRTQVECILWRWRKPGHIANRPA